MATPNNLLIIVNSGADNLYNQYASYVVAFLAKKLANVPTVTVYYGPNGVGMAKKGALAGLAIEDPVKKLIAGQIDGLSASDLPENLEQLARFERDQLGVNIVSCATFNVIAGLSSAVDDTSGLVDFITPVALPQAAGALMAADKILYF
jgi:predicted peroxiredoxin